MVIKRLGLLIVDAALGARHERPGNGFLAWSLD